MRGMSPPHTVGSRRDCKNGLFRVSENPRNVTLVVKEVVEFPYLWQLGS